MGNSAKVIAGVVVVAALGGGYYFWKTSATPPPVTPPPVQTLPSPQAVPATSENSVRYPVPKDSAAGAGLPSLNESDPNFQESLIALFGKTEVETIFKLKDLIRRIVVLVENAKEKTLPLDLSPFRTLSGSFLVKQENGKLWIDPKNDARYEIYSKVIQTVDEKKFADLYFKFYSLFQAAYQEINARVYFNDRVIQVIDHLLATPDTHAPIEVLAFNQSYHYADPALEDLSASQKAMIRMGSEKTAMIKEKLRKVRNLLILGQ